MTVQSPTPFPNAPAPERISFDRAELSTILSLYGRMVAVGEWRDYAMDFGADRAVFSVFRRAAEVPQARIEKDPMMRNRQGMYLVRGSEGQILRRGHELAQVLKVLERPLIRPL